MGIASSPIGIVVVGYGYWGPIIVRNVLERPELTLMGVCELDESRTRQFRQRHPGVWVDREFEAALVDPLVEAIAIATPTSTHYELARRALEAGKHVLIEKPLAATATDALALIELAAHVDRVLMPGHTFVYSPSVNKVRDLVREDVLGEIYFVTSTRMNLGNYQEMGVIYDLAPHDLSILMRWIDKPLVQIAATGRSVFQANVPETAFLTLTFAGGAQANVQISWLAPRKIRQMVVVGSKRMVQYEDTESDESVRIYDRGLDFSQPENFGEYRLTYRGGDMVAPRIEAAEPMSLELQDFAQAIRNGVEPQSNALLGLQIVLALEAAERSLKNSGEPVAVPSAADVILEGSTAGDTNGASPSGRGSRPALLAPNSNGARPEEDRLGAVGGGLERNEPAADVSDGA